MAFLRGEADVLVSTCIIESGIDIPQANTLIVDRADLFGLSQLYQIRGRVGRSRERAYAYLLYPSAAALTPEAADRLSALSDYTELGAGFKVAMRDLELRGAGNLLGDEQSGHVAALGFELYMQMLDEAVRDARSRRGRCGTARAGAPRRQRRRLRARGLHPVRAGEGRRAPADRGRARGLRADGAARRARGPLRRDPGAAREPDHAPAGADQARSRGRDRRCPSRAVGWRSRRSISTPRRRAACARRCPARTTRRAALSCRSECPTTRLSASRRWCARRTRCYPSSRLPKSRVKRSGRTRKPPLRCAAGRRQFCLRRALPPRPRTSNVPFSALFKMIKAARIVLSLAAVAGVGATFAACGGVPGNAVATVDGEAIEKQEFTHWMTVAAKSSGSQNAAVPDPDADYAKCVAAKRKATPAPAKGQPKVTDAQLKTQCKTEYEQLRNQVLQLLISFQWIQGEADAMGIKVSDAEVKKSFDEQKKQSFPKEEDYKKFIQQSGQTEEDILQRVKLDLLSNKIRDKVVKGKDKVSDKAIAGLLQQEQGPLRPAREARPARRADQDQGQRRQGPRRARERRLLEGRRQEVLDRRHVEGRRRQAPGAGQGHARQGARRRRLLAPRRASSSARSRPSTATTSSRSPTSPRRASRRSPRPRRRSSRPSSRRSSRRRWTPS